MKPDLTFERFLEVFVPGVLLSVGTWYLHRPFLLRYFPAVAADSGIFNDANCALGGKAFVFSIVALSLGLLCSQMSDIAVVGLIADKCQSTKARRWDRAILRWGLHLFIFTSPSDPRIDSIKRYLASPRREVFLRMLSEWCATDEGRLETPDEIVITHQHILSHLQILSSESRAMVADMYRPVAVAASIFTASAVLVPIALLSFATRALSIDQVAVHPDSVLWIMTIGAYLFAVASCFSLRRRFRHYCSQVLTLALHSFLNTKDSGNE